MSSFRWPPRQMSDRSEREAALAAQQGLERLRARGRKLREVPPPKPQKSTVLLVPQEPAPAAPPPPTRRPAPPPDPPPSPWDELDVLTEELVAELRRDLGPEQSDAVVADLVGDDPAAYLDEAGLEWPGEEV
jgi:hypothetical protein